MKNSRLLVALAAILVMGPGPGPGGASPASANVWDILTPTGNTTFYSHVDIDASGPAGSSDCHYSLQVIETDRSGMIVAETIVGGGPGGTKSTTSSSPTWGTSASPTSGDWPTNPSADQSYSLKLIPADNSAYVEIDVNFIEAF